MRGRGGNRLKAQIETSDLMAGLARLVLDAPGQTLQVPLETMEDVAYIIEGRIEHNAKNKPFLHLHVKLVEKSISNALSVEEAPK